MSRFIPSHITPGLAPLLGRQHLLDTVQPKKRNDGLWFSLLMRQ
jgi:hypothetical protein